MPDGIDAMLAFYRNTRADDCSLDEDGDMLLFQWGTHDWGEGPCFELGITRQFIGPHGEDPDCGDPDCDELDVWQLSLTLVFSPNTIPSGDRWCHSPAEQDEFSAFVRTHGAYLAAVRATPVRVELHFESAE